MPGYRLNWSAGAFSFVLNTVSRVWRQPVSLRPTCSPYIIMNQQEGILNVYTDTDTLTLTWTELTTHCCCFGESCSCFWSIAAVTESMQTLKMSTTQPGRWSLVVVGVSFYGASFIKPMLQTCFGESLLIMTLDQWKLAPTNDKDW